MRKKLLSVALCATMVAGLFAGCGSSSNTSKKDDAKSADGKITLNVINYHVGTDYAADYYEYLFDAFKKTEEGKNVEFKFEEIPTTDAYNQKIKLLISSGDLPDIVLNGGNNITALAAKSGKVTDITEYLDNDPDWKAMFSDQDLEFNSYEGKIYGIPVSKEISYIYYNKDLFKKAGLEAPDVAYETWDDFYKACDTLKAKGITPVSMDTADLGWLSNLWYSGLIGTAGEEGNKFMNTMYPTDYTSDLVVNATEQLQKMLKNYTTSDAAGGKYDTMATHFFNSEVAMLPNGPWMIPDFKSTDKSNTYLPNGMAEDEEAECARYEGIMKQLGNIDMQLLGIGLNGHIGFNEPGESFEKTTHCVQLTQSTIDANQRLFDEGEAVPEKAFTMGIKSIMQSKHILLIANGEKKAQIIRDAFFGPVTPKVPASILQLHNNVTVIVDKEAGKLIKDVL